MLDTANKDMSMVSFLRTCVSNYLGGWVLFQQPQKKMESVSLVGIIV